MNDASTEEPDSISSERPHVVAHVAVALNGSTRGFAPDLAVQQLADLVGATLPRFASPPHRDPRAPVNLLPIAGLEDTLHHLLGDRDLLNRHLRQAVAA